MTSDQEMVGDRYLLGGLLGRGGMAEVRRGVDTRLGRAVAVKRLSGELAADPTARSRFQREAKSAASLNHPNIVSIYDSGEDSDPETGASVPFLVMEVVEGRTLRALLQEGGRLSPERALELTQGVLAALASSHQGGVIHRDIKPANVMLTPTGVVKVMDFGIARTVTAGSTSLSQTAGVLGTAQYFSPEQARGETADARSDLYATGCLLYELLVGRPPFVGESALSIAYQHVRESPAPPSRVDPAISPAVDAIVLKALAKDPDDRYQSAAEMSADLDRVRAGEEVVEPPPAALVQDTQQLPAPATDQAAGGVADTGPETAADAPRDRRRRAVPALLLALILVLLGVGGYSLNQSHQGVAGAAQPVVVPTVLGSTRSEATQQLTRAHLLARFRETAGPDDRTLRRVTTQQPQPGQQVTPDSVVDLVLNLGPDVADVPPGLVGTDVDAARRLLKQAGFSHVKRTKAASVPSGARADEVLSVDPGEGSVVKLDDEVVLTYADRDALAVADQTKGDSGDGSGTSSDSATRSRDTGSAGGSGDDSSSAPGDGATSSKPSRSSRPTATGTSEPTGSSPTGAPTVSTEPPSATTPPASQPGPSSTATKPSKPTTSAKPGKPAPGKSTTAKPAPGKSKTGKPAPGTSAKPTKTPKPSKPEKTTKPGKSTSTDFLSSQDAPSGSD